MIQRQPFGGELEFEQAFDFYQQVVYDATALARSVADLLLERNCRKVLDCAAGTGTPALQLRALLGREGYQIDCSDGDKGMVEQFCRNARLMGVDESCEVRSWDDLDQVDVEYDYVMCRGNSLVYAQSWNGSSAVASTDCIIDYLDKMVSVLAPGGYLHVDAPGDHGLALRKSVISAPANPSELQPAWPPARISVDESVRDRGEKRYWQCKVAVQLGELPEQVTSFTRWSSNLTIDELEQLLRKVGLDEIERIGLEGDRTSGHAAVLARKPFKGT